MSLFKTETKVVLILIPEELGRNFQALQALHIERSMKGLDYRLNELNRREVDQHFAEASRETKNCLLRFQLEAIESQKQQASQRISLQKSGMAARQLVAKALVRHLHQTLQELLPHLAQSRCYHKIKKSDLQRYSTLPCRFLSTRPVLKFEVRQQHQEYKLVIEVQLDEETLPLESFTRNHFLLEKDQTYTLLSFKDYQTLQWLCEPELNVNSRTETGFRQNILSRLEAEYTVNRNGLLAEKEVQVLPTSRLWLSELNNSFLLLTPQFLYDDIIIDGAWCESTDVTIAGQRLRIKRDQTAEKEFIDLLTDLHPNFPKQNNGYFHLPFSEAQKKQWFSKSYHKLLDRNVEVAGMDLLKHFRYSPHRAETVMRTVQSEGSFLRLHMTVHFGKESVTLIQLQKTLYAGQHAVPLKDGSLGMLSEDWIAKYAAILKHGSARGSEIVISRFFGLIDGQESASALAEGDLRDTDWWTKWTRWQTSPESIFDLPTSISATLRPYQQKGFEWLSLLAEIGAGGCLADDMGLGKTIQTICFLARHISLHPAQQQLIVCPTSLIYNWQKELQQFAPSISAEILHASAKPVEKNELKSQIIITSYGMLRSNAAMLSEREFGVAVLDESHNIKNPSAQITRAVQEIRAVVRITLSGTPVVNNTEDLFSQLNFSVPGLFKDREFFRREYAHPIDRFGDEGKIKALQKLTSPFILRRTKAQVATDLPEKTKSVLWCTMGAAQQELYNEIKDQIRSRLLGDFQNNGFNKSKLAVLSGLLKLRQVCNDPRLLPENERSGCSDSVKLNVLMEELSSLLGRHKVLVFSQFSSMLELLAQTAAEKGIGYYLLDGKTAPEKRMKMVNDFQTEGEPTSLFLISLKAGNTGLTLTSADYVFLFDPWWNTAVEEQAIDRTYRIGQKRNVFAYKMICKNTIEEKIIELQNRKKHVADELISEDEGFVKTLSEEDIMYLLQ